jgi:eukaryotic-like serine/threonine-protein kinase
MSTSSDARNPVELLAEDFLDRKRRGEHPTLREYVERHPELADEIRDLFPALFMMENLGDSSGATTGSLAADDGAALGIRIERLGDYRILREIGRGGMGVVYEAEQESLGRRVALKVLSTGSMLDPKQVRRFEREAKAAAKLHHTNIVPVFGVGRQDGHHYFVMQFITGLGLDVVLEDLRRLRQPKSGASRSAVPAAASSRIAGLTAGVVARSLVAGRFAAGGLQDGSVTEPFQDADSAALPTAANGSSPETGSSSALLTGSSELSASSDPDRQFFCGVARIGLQVAEALEYANRQGILHRDVKPSNLLLDHHGNVWVADFGLAKTAEADDLTHTGDILGTIRYMAPERFSGRCDARSDVYSLGLTLYELVALKPAYEASDRHTLMDRVLHEEPERLKKLAPGVPRDLETIVAKATARDPGLRYATAAALADDLRRFVEDRPIRARRISVAERLVRWCRRNKGLAASIGVAAAALVAVAVFALLYATEQSRLATHQSLRVAEQRVATEKITRLAGDLDRRGKALESSLAESNSRLARLDLERGQAAFEKGQLSIGMLWTVESLRMAAAAGDEAGRHVALANLSAWRRHHTDLKQLFSLGGIVTAVAFSPDGKTILAGSHDKTARLWDADTGRQVGQPMVHPGTVESVAFSPDGKMVLTGSGDNAARLWDSATGRSIGKPLQHQGAVFAVAFSPDGKIIATAGNDRKARLWDAASGRPLVPPLPHPGIVPAVVFSPDGTTILTGCYDRIARFWDVATGQSVGQTLRHSSILWSVAFSPDGKLILTGGWDKTARLWDAVTGRQLGQPMEHRDLLVRSAAFSPDGKTILTGCGDNTAQLWDAATGQRIGRDLELQGEGRSVAFSPDGRSILAGSQDTTVRLWAFEIGQPDGRPLELGGDAGPVRFSHDGKALLSLGFDGKAQVWDVASGHRLGKPVKFGSATYALKSSPDGKVIATASTDNAARLWNAASGQPIGQPMRHSALVSSVAFSPDGKSIVTCSRDRTARLWDASTGRPLGPPLPHPDEVQSVAFSPDGKTFLTGGTDNTARLWSVATGQQVGQPVLHSGWVVSVAFSPDGKTILTGSWDRTARLSDAATGRPLGPPLRHSGFVSFAAFSPDGKTIAIGSGDNTARLWDAATGQPIGPPMPHPSSSRIAGPSVGFSPDGRLILTSDNNTARLWVAPALLPDDLPRLAAWVEAATGLELDERGSIRVLDRAAWLERRSRLEQLGGPPPADLAPRLDPILFGRFPAARGDDWSERGMPELAEAAYDEAVRARPFNRSAWYALARSHVERGHLDGAVTTLAEAVRLIPDDLELRGRLGVALLWSGDRSGWRRSTAALLDHFGGTVDAETAYHVARACVLGPEGSANIDMPIRLAEAAVRGATETTKDLCLTTLGAALYRAGRFDDAILRLEEGIRASGGIGQRDQWVLLAMAHHRLGHRDQATRWLNRRGDLERSASAAQFWTEMPTHLLSNEAEALILYDPIFPADPFAH